MISKIKATMRVYSGPVLISVLSVLGAFWWFNLVPHHVNKYGQQKNAQLVYGIFDFTASTLQGLSSHCKIQNAMVQRVLEGITVNSVLRYAIIQKEGQDIIRTSQAPTSINLPSDTGHQVERERFLYWRKIQLKCKSPSLMNADRRVAKPKDSNADLVLILAGEIPRDHSVFLREVKKQHLILALAFLCVTICAINWVMVINRKLKSEKNKNKHLRLNHLEELSLAAAGLAHETKNPLGLISAIAQQISRCPDTPDEHLKRIKQIIDEVDNASARLDHFMKFARQQDINTKSIEASQLIGHVTNVLDAEFEAMGVKLVAHCRRIWIIADEKALRQILVNLLLNSLQASAQGESVSMRLKIHGNRAKLQVEDNGSGISEELLPNILKPYVTGRSNGHGLGLAIVKRQIEEHGWTIRIISGERKGTRVTISGIILTNKNH